ncbi:fungal cellulose binding domain-containing [Brachionus plicatilis]|uniref:Fungal cellulose binding domain-containing n=1 Tax=Brachionus plicatilis TaxID=10195 RepID=A0A3M7RLP5_BRAPC|nr:fungal cellulose binding domain-containing [Brachionus plicatilis]
MRKTLVILSILSILITKYVSGQKNDFNCPHCCKLTIIPKKGEYLIGCVCSKECTCSNPFNCDCPDDCKLGEAWGQCDGLNWKGPFTCQTGLECVFSNKWYSQCKTSNKNQEVNKDQGAIWSQCGGENWKGPLTCQPGLECVFSNKWYSQCKPSNENQEVNKDQGAIWSQCGGENWKGPSTCQPGLECVFSNKWYSQCKPSNENEPVKTTPAKPINQDQGAIWSQCGGENWKGPSTCQPGLECVFSNKWYSQCKPV